MMPIHQLLSRIRWDPAFGRGRIEIAYVDHRRRNLVRLPLDRIDVRPGDRFAFEVDEGGAVRTIPFHRVRVVTRDGAVIWSRPAPPGR